MKLIGPLLFVAIGMIIGLAVRALFGQLLGGSTEPSARASMLAGTVGSFAGLWLPGLLGFELEGPLNGTLPTAALGAALLSTALSLAMRRPR